MNIKKYKKLTNINSKINEEKKLTLVFNLYVRLRDLVKNSRGQILGGCIACGKIWKVDLYSDKSIINHNGWCASHYWRSDLFASVRFDERNVNLSCYHCNKRLSGNLSNYERHLRLKIGDKEFEKLYVDRNKTMKYNIIELNNLARYYKLKVKKEAERLGIKI